MSQEATPPALAWSLGQALLVGAIRAAVVALAMGAAFAWIGWPLAGAALGVAGTGVEAWARRQRLEPRTILLGAAWAAVLGAFAVGWGFLQGIYAAQLWRTGSPEEARGAVLVAYRGIYDAEQRKDALWKEVLPWLQRDEGDPRTPLLVLAAASGLILAARLAAHRPFAFRHGRWVRAALSPVALPLLGLLPTLIASWLLWPDRLIGLLSHVCWGHRPWQHAAAQAALALAFLAMFALPCAASLADLAARRPRGEPPPDLRPGPWAARGLLPGLLVLWLGFVTLPARAWPTKREEALAYVARGSVPALDRAAALSLLCGIELDSADPVAGEAARKAASDPEPAVRMGALQLLARLDPHPDLDPLVAAGLFDADGGVRGAAWDLVGKLPPHRRPVLARQALRDRDPAVRIDALKSAEEALPDGEWAVRLLAAFDDPDPRVRQGALGQCWRLRRESSLIPKLRRLLSDPIPAVRLEAIEALAYTSVSLAEVPELVQALDSSDPREHEAAVWTVSSMASSDLERVVALLLRELERELTAGSSLTAAEALGNVGLPAAGAAPRLREHLQGPLRPEQRDSLERAIQGVTGS